MSIRIAVATRPREKFLVGVWIAQALLALALSLMAVMKIMTPIPDLDLSVHRADNGASWIAVRSGSRQELDPL